MKRVRIVGILPDGTYVCSDGRARRLVGNLPIRTGQMVWADGGVIIGWRARYTPLVARPHTEGATGAQEDYLIWIDELGDAFRYDTGEPIGVIYSYPSTSAREMDSVYYYEEGNYAAVVTLNTSVVYNVSDINDDLSVVVLSNCLWQSCSVDMLDITKRRRVTNITPVMESSGSPGGVWVCYQDADDWVGFTALACGYLEVRYTTYTCNGLTSVNISCPPDILPGSVTVIALIREGDQASQTVQVDDQGDGTLSGNHVTGTVEYGSGQIRLQALDGYAFASVEVRFKLQPYRKGEFFGANIKYRWDGTYLEATYSQIGTWEQSVDGSVISADLPDEGWLAQVWDPVDRVQRPLYRLKGGYYYDASNVIEDVAIGRFLDDEASAMVVNCQRAGSPVECGLYYEVYHQCDGGDDEVWPYLYRTYDKCDIVFPDSESKYSPNQTTLIRYSDLDSRLVKFDYEYAGEVPPCDESATYTVSCYTELDKVPFIRRRYEYTDWSSNSFLETHDKSWVLGAHRVGTPWGRRFSVYTQVDALNRPMDYNGLVAYWFGGSYRYMQYAKVLDGTITWTGHYQSDPTIAALNITLTRLILCNAGDSRLIDATTATDPDDRWALVEKIYRLNEAEDQVKWAFSAVHGDWKVYEHNWRLDRAGNSGYGYCKIVLPKWVGDLLMRI